MQQAGRHYNVGGCRQGSGLSIVIRPMTPVHGGAFQRDAVDDCEEIGLLSGGLVSLDVLGNCFNKGVCFRLCG